MQEDVPLGVEAWPIEKVIAQANNPRRRAGPPNLLSRVGCELVLRSTRAYPCPCACRRMSAHVGGMSARMVAPGVCAPKRTAGKCPHAGETLEAATGVEPMMEVLQSSVDGAQP